MKPGELVELTDILLVEGDDDPIIVGDLKGRTDGQRRFASGTIAILVGDYLLEDSDPASVILVGGSLGWVWNHEIRPVLDT